MIAIDRGIIVAEERLSYTIPADASGDAGSQVDLILTYDAAKPNADMSFTVTDATGTYATLDANGKVVDSDKVTGVAPPVTGYGGPDNELFVGSAPYVTNDGITFTIDNKTDSNDGMGAVNFSTPDGKHYYEDGDNSDTPASMIAENDVPCFVLGTAIGTASGEVAVERLRIGDLAATSKGALRTIRWIGHRTVDCRRHPRPDACMPIRIAANAFGADRPSRDLRVSPGHSICVDVVGEVLIPAGVLVNGTTVVQEQVDRVTYFHVELDAHDIILADNMPVESYLEMANRAFFAESGCVALDAAPDAAAVTHADFCRPFHADGTLVEVVRARLATRAGALGWRLEPPAQDDLCLEVDGARLPRSEGGPEGWFTLPAGARDVWLVSSTSIPATVAGTADRRRLGICLHAIAMKDGHGALQTVEADDPRLCVGFHAVERDAATLWRWSRGRARLPASLWQGLQGDVALRLDFAGPALPRWVAPVPAALSGARPSHRSSLAAA